MVLFEPKNIEEFNKIFADVNNVNILVYLTATWCQPCRAIAPVFKRLAEANQSIAFVKVDVDLCSQLPVCQTVQGVPTFVAYRGKIEVKRVTGASEKNIQITIDELK